MPGAEPPFAELVASGAAFADGVRPPLGATSSLLLQHNNKQGNLLIAYPGQLSAKGGIAIVSIGAATFRF